LGEIKKQGISNAIISYIGIAIGFINLLVLQPILLSPEEIGLTRILFSFSSIMSTVIPLGMINITLRFFPIFENKEKKHNGFFGFSILIAFVGFVFVGLVLFLTKDFFIEKYGKHSSLFIEFFNYVFPLSFFLALISIMGSYSAALLKTSFPSFLNDIFTRLLNIILFSVYFLKFISIETMIFLFVCIYLLQTFILFLYINKIDSPGYKIDIEFFIEKKVFTIIQYGLLFSIAAISSIGLRYIDSIIIGMYLPLAQVGVYSVCAFIPTIIEAPLLSLERITNAKIGKAWQENNLIELDKIYTESVKYLLLLGGLLFVGININIKQLLSFLPNDYHQAFTIVYIISLGSFINISTGVNSGIIFFSKKYKIGLMLLAMLFILTIVLDLILIPIYGTIGAAIATAISSILFNFSKFLYVKNKFGFNPFKTKYFGIQLIIAICFFINKFFMPEHSNKIIEMLIKSCVATFVYMLFIIRFNYWPEINNKIKSIFTKL
jgi:O-antigen/teichoic acid export membrane protein